MALELFPSVCAECTTLAELKAAGCSLYIVADTEAEMPSASVTPSDLCYAKDTDTLYKREASAWVAVGGGSAAWGAVTGTLADQTDLQTALNAKQASDTDLTTIAGLTATTDNFMVAAASAWASRTPTQAKTSLALVKGDVGLGNVDNTTDAGKPVSSAQQTALDAKASTTHATAHKSGGADTIKLDELAAPTDVTTLNATTAAHGLMMKYPGGTTTYLRADASFASVTATAAPGWNLNPAANEILPTNTSHTVNRRYVIASTKNMTIGSGAIMRIL